MALVAGLWTHKALVINSSLLFAIVDFWPLKFGAVLMGYWFDSKLNGRHLNEETLFAARFFPNQFIFNRKSRWPNQIKITSSDEPFHLNQIIATHWKWSKRQVHSIKFLISINYQFHSTIYGITIAIIDLKPHQTHSSSSPCSQMLCHCVLRKYFPFVKEKHGPDHRWFIN